MRLRDAGPGSLEATCALTMARCDDDFSRDGHRVLQPRSLCADSDDRDANINFKAPEAQGMTRSW